MGNRIAHAAIIEISMIFVALPLETGNEPRYGALLSISCCKRSSWRDGQESGASLADAQSQRLIATVCVHPASTRITTYACHRSNTMTPLLRRQLVVVPLSVLLGFLLASLGFRNGLDETVFGNPYGMGGGYNALGKLKPLSKYCHRKTSMPPAVSATTSL